MTADGRATRGLGAGREVLALAAGDIAGRVATMLAWIVMARALGEQGFGLVSWCLAIVAYASIPADGGLAAFGTRELARDPHSGSAHAIRRLRFALSAAVFVLVLAVGRWLLDPERWLVLACAVAWVLPASLNPEWLLQGRHRVAAIGALRFAIGASLLLAAIAWSQSTPGGAVGASALRAVAELAVVGAFAVLGWTRLGPRPVDVPAALPVLRQSLPMAGATLLTGLYAANFDVLVLGQARSIAEAGLYAAAFRLYLMLAVLPKLLLVQAYPRFAAAAVQPGALQREIDRFMALSLRFGLPVVVLAWTLATELIDVVYGAAYRDSAPVLRLLALAALPLLLNAPFPSVLLAAGKTGPALAAFGGALAISIGINLVATPQWGMPAAAGAVILAEATVLVLAWWHARRSLGIGFPRGLAAQAAVGASTLLVAQAAHALCVGAQMAPAGVVVAVSLAGLAAWALATWLLMRWAPRPATQEAP